MHITENLIIGAGPAGLAMAGCFTRAHLPYTLIERSQQVAPAWHHHYDRLHLHTVKELSHLPHKPFPEDYPQYVPRHLVAEYCEAYAREFQIKPHFGHEAQRIEPQPGHWTVTTTQGIVYQAQRVIVCTGFNRKVNRPTWPGEADFQGKIIHSRSYRNGAAFTGQRVLVIGMGNTGAELAADLYEHGAQPSISVRSPVNIVLRDPLGRPVQKTALMLAKLPPWLGDALGRFTARLTVGNLEPYGLKKSPLAPGQQLRETGQTPVIDVGTLPLIKTGKVKVLPAVQRFTPRGVVCEGQEHDFDVVVLATGYRPALADLLAHSDDLFDPRGYPKHWQAQGQPGLYFLGFDGYTAGGLLYVIRRDAPIITDHIARVRQTAASLAAQP